MFAGYPGADVAHTGISLDVWSFFTGLCFVVGYYFRSTDILSYAEHVQIPGVLPSSNEMLLLLFLSLLLF